MWVKLDPGFSEHPKLVGLSDAAFRAHVRALCWCGRNLTDGVLSAGALKSMGTSKKLVQSLVDSGLWEVRGELFVIHDYLDFNPSREEVAERQAEVSRKRALAGRKGAESRWRGGSKRDGKADGKTDGKPPEPDGNCHGKSLANGWPDLDLVREDLNTNHLAKDLTGFARENPDPGELSESKPAENKLEPVRVVGAAFRKRAERPQVDQELPTRSHPRDVEVPIDFAEFADELGLSSQAYADAVTDWREKCGPSTHKRLFDVLCRFIESRARRREKSVVPSSPSAQQHVVDDAPRLWTPPPEPPRDPNPPPPNPITALRARASNG